MEEFYEGLEPEAQLELSKFIEGTTYQKLFLDKVLGGYGAASIEDLLTKIESSEVEEHPSYEDYLSAKTFEINRQELKKECRNLMETF